MAAERAPSQVMGGHRARVTVLPKCPPGSRGQSTIMTTINITIREQDSAGGLGCTDGDGEVKKRKNKVIYVLMQLNNLLHF